MGLTIDEALKIIKDGRIVATIIKGNNEDDTKFNQENIEALNTIVYTMRKYQKIEQIISDGYLQGKSSGEMLLNIKGVMNGNDTN